MTKSEMVQDMRVSVKGFGPGFISDVKSNLRFYAEVTLDSGIKGLHAIEKIRSIKSRSTEQRKQLLSASDEVWNKIVIIFKNDKHFAMPISVPPAQEELVENEISGALNGMTVATEKKLMPSYDVVYSYSPDVVTLLEQVGVSSELFFNNEEICLAHGPRKEFYFKLIELGFSPSKLSQ